MLSKRKIIAVVVLMLIVGFGVRLLRVAPTSAIARSAISRNAVGGIKNGGMTPNGTLDTVGGRILSLRSFRGTTTMLWFMVAGCASCVSSVPAVAGHMRTLQSHGVRVVSVDLYGDLPQTPQGRAEFFDFMSSVSKLNNPNSSWIWGLASKSLSYRLDPKGIPDLYYLIGPHGHIRYQNTVPLSTMRQLLQSAKSLAKVSTGNA